MLFYCIHTKWNIGANDNETHITDSKIWLIKSVGKNIWPASLMHINNCTEGVLTWTKNSLTLFSGSAFRELSTVQVSGCMPCINHREKFKVTDNVQWHKQLYGLPSLFSDLPACLASSCITLCIFATPVVSDMY